VGKAQGLELDVQGDRVIAGVEPDCYAYSPLTKMGPSWPDYRA